jgi:hypothetical protein
MRPESHSNGIFHDGIESVHLPHRQRATEAFLFRGFPFGDGA